MKSVPEVPSERLQPPSPTTPVPTAAAALSPAPATTAQSRGRPSAPETKPWIVPMTS